MICPRLRKIFVHVPKCAGTSIEQMLMALEGWAHPFYGKNTYFHVYQPGGNQHLPLSLIRETRPKTADWPAFAIVRNPYERVVSEYHYQIKVGVRTAEGETLVDSLISGSLWERAWDYHATAAVDIIDGPCYVIKMEELNDELGRLANFLGVEECVLENVNTTGARRPAKELLTSAAQAVVLDRFGEDFDRYGYAR